MGHKESTARGAGLTRGQAGIRARVRGRRLILGSPAPHPGCPQAALAGVAGVVPRRAPWGAGRRCRLSGRTQARRARKGPRRACVQVWAALSSTERSGHGPCWDPAVCAQSHHTAFTESARYAAPKGTSFLESTPPEAETQPEGGKHSPVIPTGWAVSGSSGGRGVGHPPGLSTAPPLS